MKTPFDIAWESLRKSPLPIGPIDAPYWNTFGRTERQLEVPPGRARNQRAEMMREPRFEGDEEEPVDTRVLGESGYWGKDLGELQEDQSWVDWWNNYGRHDYLGSLKERPSVLPPPEEVNQSLEEAAKTWAKKKPLSEAHITNVTPSVAWDKLMQQHRALN